MTGLRSQAWNFVRLTRVPFLLGGFVVYALGAAAAARQGVAINWGAYWLGQVVVTATQLMAQYLNEYYDVEVDRLGAENRTWFSGGSGILAGGVAPPAALAAARLCGAAALLAGVPACIFFPWMIPIGALSLVGSWFYSAPPIALMASGWGELTTSLIVAVLAPLTGYTLQGGLAPGELWLVTLLLALVHAAMLISFEFPDYRADLAVGKKTLAVRLGLRGAAWLATGLIACAYLLLAGLSLFSNFPGQWMGWAVPLAVWQVVMIWRATRWPTRMHYHILTTGGVGLFALMALLAALGFVFKG